MATMRRVSAEVTGMRHERESNRQGIRGGSVARRLQVIPVMDFRLVSVAASYEPGATDILVHCNQRTGKYYYRHRYGNGTWPGAGRRSAAFVMQEPPYVD